MDDRRLMYFKDPLVRAGPGWGQRGPSQGDVSSPTTLRRVAGPRLLPMGCGDEEQEGGLDLGGPDSQDPPHRPQDAFARGEVFIGSRESGYTVLDGLPPSTQGHHWPHGITIVTPERRFLLACETETEQRAWVEAFRKVVDRPMLPQEYAGKCRWGLGREPQPPMWL